MKKLMLQLFLIMMLAGCYNMTGENSSEDTSFMDDPQYMGLMAYNPVTTIEYNNNLYFDYDSLLCYYGVVVIIKDSDWSKKHDHLRVQRIKIDCDTNYWDCASLYGKRRGDTEWEEICNKGVLPHTLDSCYYRMLEIIDVIGYEIESGLYYFDSVEWARNPDHYENLCKRKHVEFNIRGKTYLIRPKIRQQ